MLIRHHNIQLNPYPNQKYSELYELGNVSELGSILSRVINNQAEIRMKAKQAQEYAVNTFTAEKNAEHIYELYKNLLCGSVENRA